jgi:hypothetical protein
MNARRVTFQDEMEFNDQEELYTSPDRDVSFTPPHQSPPRSNPLANKPKFKRKTLANLY